MYRSCRTRGYDKPVIDPKTWRGVTSWET